MEGQQGLDDVVETARKVLPLLGTILIGLGGLPFLWEYVGPHLHVILPQIPVGDLKTEGEELGGGLGGAGAVLLAANILLEFLETRRRKAAIFEGWSLADRFRRNRHRVRKWSAQEGEWTFSPRPSVLARIDAGLKEHFAIQVVGDPGAGKTEILEHLLESTKKRDDWITLAYHFCQSDDVQTLQPREFVKNLFYCIHHGRLGKLLDRPRALQELESSEQNAAADSLRKLVWEPLNRAGEANGLKWLLIVDALDEAAEFSGKTTIVDLLESLLRELSGQPLSQWLRVVVSTRPGTAALRGGRENLLQIEIDEVSADDDVRAYIAERLRSKPELGPYIADIAGIAKGNFLLARYLVRDLADTKNIAARLGDYVPGDVNRYYEANFFRLFGKKLPISAHKLLAVILAEAESLSVADLARAAELEPEERDDVLARLAAFCRREKSSEDAESENDTIGVFHKTFSDWLADEGSSPNYHVNAARGHELLADWCKSTFDESKEIYKKSVSHFRDSAADLYLLEHGTDHYIKVGRFSDAVEFVDFLLSYWNDTVAVKYLPRSITPRRHARAVLLALPDRKETEAEKEISRISSLSLVNLVRNVYQIGVLARALDILILEESGWEKNVEACLSTENYVLRFKLAETLAAACCEDGSFVERQHILHYLYDPDVNHAELGAYTLGHLYVAQPAEIDLAVLAKLQTDRHSYALRQVFGAILLNLALRRRVRRGSDNRLIVDVSAGPDPERISEAIDPAHTIVLDRESPFWTSQWEHLRIDMADIDAAISYFSGGEGGMTKAHEHFAATEALRNALEKKESLHRFSSVRALLDRNCYFGLAKDTRKIDDMADDLESMPSELRKEIVALLFSHPVWNVGETAASVLAEVYEASNVLTRRDVRYLIEELLDPHLDWRVNLGAVEAAYILIEMDPDLFLGADMKDLGAAGRFHDDRRSSRLRALCAEDFITYVLERAQPLQLDLLKKFDQCVNWWLNDEDDCWVLEHVFRLLKTLAKDRAQNRLNADYVRYLDTKFAESKSPFLVGIGDWASITRGEFLARIETIKAGSDPRPGAGLTAAAS